MTPEALLLALLMALIKATSQRERAQNPRRWDAAKLKVKNAIREALLQEEPDVDRLLAIATESAKELGDDDDGVATLRRQARNIRVSKAKKKAAVRPVKRRRARRRIARRRIMNGGSRRKSSRRRRRR